MITGRDEEFPELLKKAEKNVTSGAKGICLASCQFGFCP